MSDNGALLSCENGAKAIIHLDDLIKVVNLHMYKIKLYQWSFHTDLNGEPITYKAIALPIVLWKHIIDLIEYYTFETLTLSIKTLTLYIYSS